VETAGPGEIPRTGSSVAIVVARDLNQVILHSFSPGFVLAPLVLCSIKPVIDGLLVVFGNGERLSMIHACRAD